MERRQYEHTVTLKFTAKAFEDVLFALMINKAIKAAETVLEKFDGEIKILYEEPFVGDER